MTNYSLVDAAGLLLSILCGLPLVLAPGVLLAWAGALADPRANPAEPRSVMALLAGLATLPLLDSLLVRSFGLDAALATTLLLGVAGAVAAVWSGWRLRLCVQDAILALVWLLVVLVETIDFDAGGGLHHPFLILDMVKHSATIQAIHDGGAPPPDPFFLRPGRVGYYYFFYTLGALSERLCGGLAGARAAMGGLVFWTGCGFYGLVRLCLARSGFGVAPWSRRTGLILFALMWLGGLDILGVLRIALTDGRWLPIALWWNEQIGGAADSLLWVPHHVCAMLAALLAFMALSDEAKAGRWRRVAFAGACLASALGLSAWVTLGAVATAGLWLIGLVRARRFGLAAALLAAGLISLALAAPQLLDLHAGREPGPFPIALTVRRFGPVEMVVPPGPVRLVARLVCLPLNYLSGFGVLCVGALLFWRERDRRAPVGEFGRVLLLAGACGLFIGAFFKSTLYNNDLGWRVLLFPLVVGEVLSVAALERRFAALDRQAASPPRPWRAVPGLMWALGALGLATTAYTLVADRAFTAWPLHPQFAFFKTDPRTERDLRTAYVWADAHLPAGEVLQHDPVPPRVFPFGLYGRNRVAAADISAGLYGARQAAIDRRVANLSPIFTSPIAPAAVRALARAEHVDALVVSDADPAWRRRGSWVWTSAPLFAAPRARIIAVTALGSPP